MTSRAQKLSGYPIPSIIAPETTRSYCVTIPDDEGYYQAMYAQLILLGKWWKWKHNADANNPEASYSAEEWRNILAIEEGCGTMPIDCEEVEACLTTSPTISDINDALAGLAGSTSGGYNPANTTKPIENGGFYSDINTELNTPVNSCDDSDKDSLWGVIANLVDYINSRNKAFADAIYLPPTSNDLLDRLFNIFPILQSMENTIVNNFNDAIDSIVLGTYSSLITNAILNEIKCDLFCSSVATDCTFDIKQAFDYFAAESIPTFSEVESIQDAVIAIGDLATLTPKELFCSLAVLQISSAAVGEFWTSQKTLGAYVNAAQSGGGNRAWAYLCDECSTPPATWTIVLDFMGNYSALAGEIVYRPEFDLIGTGPTNSTVTQTIDGLEVRYTSAGAVRRTIYLESPIVMSQVQWRARCKDDFTSRTRFQLNDASGSQNTLLGTTYILPVGVGYQDSAILNQNATVPHIGFTFTGVDGGGYAGSVAWLKITGTGTPPILA